MLSDSHGCCIVIGALLFDGAIDPALGALTVGAVIDHLNAFIDHLNAFIDALPERPILIGHSIGGLAVQKLVNDNDADNDASVMVAISSAPPQGVFSAFELVETGSPKGSTMGMRHPLLRAVVSCTRCVHARRACRKPQREG